MYNTDINKLISDISNCNTKTAIKQYLLYLIDKSRDDLEFTDNNIAEIKGMLKAYRKIYKLFA